MNERAMDRIVRSVGFAGNVLFYGIVFAFIVAVAALLSY